MLDLKKVPYSKIRRYRLYDFLTKYGFDDGRGVLPEEREIVKRLCHKLAGDIGVVDKRWKPLIISSSHSPYYIGFEDLTTGATMDIFDMEERERRKIEKRIDEMMNSV